MEPLLVEEFVVRNYWMLIALTCISVAPMAARADAVYHDLNSGNFSQNWSNTGLITTDDIWSGVPSIEGYRGDNLTTATGVDPQTVLAFGTSPIDVNANQSDPNGFFTGGVTEFQIANPTVALTGSGTADAPFLIFYMNSTGRTNVTLSYNLRDIETVDNSQQQVALQYRIGPSGDFTNVPSAYVTDASTGGSATQVTPVTASLAAWDNVPQLQFRIITTNAIGNDEWIGVDDILITSVPEASAFLFGGLVCGMLGLGISCRRAVKSARAAV